MKQAMKLNLNAKETVELLVHLERTSGEDENVQIREIKNRLRSYIVGVLNDVDKSQLDVWASQVKTKLENNES